MHRATTPFVVLTTLQVLAQTAPPIAWQKALGGTDTDEGLAIAGTSDGGAIVAGTTFSNDGDVGSNNGFYDVWLVKLDALGQIQWEKNYGGSAIDVAKDVIQTSDGGYLVAARSNSEDGDVPMNNGDWDNWILKLDAAGVLEWQTVHGGNGHDEPQVCAETADGYIIGGRSNSENGDVVGNHSWTFDMWVYKLAFDGSLFWQRCYGGTSSEELYDIQLMPDGGLVMAGEGASDDGDVTATCDTAFSDFWVVRTDAAGTIMWQQCYGGSDIDFVRTIRATLDGGFIVAGTTESVDGMVTGHHGDMDLWVIKLDASGGLEWQRALGGSGLENFGSATQLADGRYAVLGEAWSTDGDLTVSNGAADFWLVMLDANGNIKWDKNMGGSMRERSRSIALASDGCILAAGSTLSSDGDVTGYHLPYSSSNTDFWIVKLGSDVGIKEQATALFQLLPNPAMDQLQITLDPTLLGGRYTIVDLAGRVQQEDIVHEMQMHLDVTALPTGLYTLKIHGGDGVMAQRWVKE